MKKLLIIPAFLLISFLNSSTIIYTSSYIDVNNGKIVNDSSIVINEKKITKISAGYINIGQDDILIDLRGFTVMPGLMDMHVHFGGEYQSKAERPIKVERETEAILATAHAATTLKSGFTTVDKLGIVDLYLFLLEMQLKQVMLLAQESFLQERVLPQLGGMQTLQMVNLLMITIFPHQNKEL